jgi:LysW-gamma-L-lysine carboxypeptidase
MSHPPVSETLLGLVSHYSPSGQERAAVEYLVERMRALGYTRAFIDEAGNAVGWMGDGAQQIVFLGHIDTVAGEIPVRLVIPETGAEPPEVGPLLFGRGTVDAKGALAVFVDAVARVGPVNGWQVVVIGAVDEEGDSRGARFVKEHYHPRYAIIGEPSRWDRITLGYKGSAWAEITVRTPQAHTAGQSQNACEIACDIWQTIRQWSQQFNLGRQRLYEQVTPTLRGLASGDEDFETWARLKMGARLPEGFSPEAWYQQIGHILNGVEGAQVAFQALGFAVAAYQSPKNTPLVRAFLSSIRALAGQPAFALKSGTSDLNIVAPAWNCPAVAYGPGDSALDHTPNEHLSLWEYQRAVEVICGVLKQLTHPL